MGGSRASSRESSLDRAPTYAATSYFALDRQTFSPAHVRASSCFRTASPEPVVTVVLSDKIGSKCTTDCWPIPEPGSASYRKPSFWRQAWAKEDR
jgi:hypothetical protein